MVRRYSRFRGSKWGYRLRSRSFRRRGFGARFNVKYFAGMGVGILAPSVIPYQETILTALAVAPISLPYNLKMVAQGYVMGRLVKPYVPIGLPFDMNKNSGDFA